MPRLRFALAVCLVVTQQLSVAFNSAGAQERAPSVEAEETINDELMQILDDILPPPHVATFGVAINNLPTGEAAFLNGERRFEAASLLKLPILYEAYRQRSLGRLSFSERLVVTPRHADIAFGLTPVPVGQTLSVDQALDLMITVSDNASAIALIDRLGYNAINNSMGDLGLENTIVWRDSFTSPGDMLRYFRVLVGLEAVDEISSQEMLSRLLRQRINDRIPRLLPPGTPVAHKTGDNPGVVHDVGVIFTPGGPVVVALLAENVTDGPSVREAMARIAAALYEYSATSTP